VNLLLACGLTVLIETPLFLLFGYRRADEIKVVVCANVATNLLLNLAVMFLLSHRGTAVYLLEAVVAAAEFGIYTAAFGASWRLFWLTLAANILSYSIGLLVF